MPARGDSLCQSPFSNWWRLQQRHFVEERESVLIFLVLSFVPRKISNRQQAQVFEALLGLWIRRTGRNARMRRKPDPLGASCGTEELTHLISSNIGIRTFSHLFMRSRSIIKLRSIKDSAPLVQFSSSTKTIFVNTIVLGHCARPRFHSGWTLQNNFLPCGDSHLQNRMQPISWEAWENETEALLKPAPDRERGTVG